MTLRAFASHGRIRGRVIALSFVGALLMLFATAGSALANSDIEATTAYVGTPGNAASMVGVSVTNNGPDPAAGVAFTGTLPAADSEGKPVDWEVFTDPSTPISSIPGFLQFVSLVGPPYGIDPCSFTSSTDFNCQIGPLAVGESRVVVMNPTWETATTQTTFDPLVGVNVDAALVGGTDPNAANDTPANIGQNYYYSQSAFGGGTPNTLDITEQSPPASGVHAPGSTVTLKIVSTINSAATGSVSVVVPDRNGVSCTGDGVCLTGGQHAMTGPPNRVMVATTGQDVNNGNFWSPITLPAVFTTTLSAKLPDAPAGCTPGGTVPFTFDTTQQPVSGGSAPVYTAVVKLPYTVQIACPPASVPPPGPPAPPAAPAPPAHAPHAHVTKKTKKAKKAKLKLTKRANRKRVASGGLVAYRITVRSTRAAARHVRVCDVPPRGLAFVKRPGSKLSKGKACWTIRRLRKGGAKTFRVTARVSNPSSRVRTVTNRTRATARNAATRWAKARVRVAAPHVRAGGVTG